MPNCITHFFSDPENTLSLLALILAIVSLTWTFVNQYRQNKRWDALNLATLIVKRVSFFGWRDLDRDWRMLDWGYDHEVHSVSEDSILHSDRFTTYASIVAYDLQQSQIIQGTAAITISEIKNALERRGYHDANRFQFLKHYRIIIQLANIGGTAATVTNQSVRFRGADSKDNSLQLGEHSHTLGAQQHSFSMFEINIPLSKRLPNPLIINFAVTYLDTNGDSHTRTSVLEYDGRGWKVHNDDSAH